MHVVRWLRGGPLSASIWLGIQAALPAHAQEPFWQLTFSYNDQGLFLVRAAPIPALAKTVRTPGLDGAIIRLDYDVEWQDATGMTLSAAPATIPLGGRVILGEGPDEETHPACVMCEGGFVLRVPGPPDPSKIAQLRLLKRVQRTGLLAADAAQEANTPKAFTASEHVFPLPAGEAAAAAPPPGPVSGTRIRTTGSDSNRLVIVFMGDGFTETNLAAGAFSNKVTAFLATFLNVNPWNLYANLVNAYRVDIISNEQGADYEDASPGSGGTLKDTYLNSAFWVGNTERCLFLTGNGVSRAFAAADELVGVGVWDEILVFVNSTKYGGCGGAVGVSSVNSSSDEVQIHEFGHSFAGLADEYDYGSTNTACNPTSARNVDCSNNFPQVKWNAWVTPGTPLPTPDTSTYDNAIGAFEGAAYQRYGMFRPKRSCKMRNLGAAFCPVCKETHILKLFGAVRIVDSADPPPGPTEVSSSGARTFNVTPVNVSSFSYEWWLGGELLPDATNPSVTVAASQLTGTNVELRLVATHVTTNVRAQPILQTNLWRLSPADLPTLSIADASVREGDTGTVVLDLPVTLSFPHNETVTVEYATANATAQAAQDYATTSGVLEFAPGQTTRILPVPVSGDAVAEPNEVFFVNLSNPVNAGLGRRQGGGMILDDDHAPTVAIATPASGAVLFTPVNLGLTATAGDYDGRVTDVVYYAGSSRIGNALVSPYSCTWTNVGPGTYLLSATARDNSGRGATSPPVEVTIVAGATQQVALLSITQAWKYDASTNNYGSAWKDPGYEDSLWDGPASALFYNESARLPAPTNTYLPLTYNGGRIRSYYFRTHFTVPEEVGSGWFLVCSNLVDDGAVFWINGVEAGRLRMPAGTITRTTLASATPSGGDATAYNVLQFPAGLVSPGENVMAVEVHQQSDTSTDVVFGLSLHAMQGTPPVIVEPRLPEDAAVLQGRLLTLSVIATSAPPPAYQWFLNNSPIPGATNAAYAISNASSADAGDYLAQVTNAVGSVDSRRAEVAYLADTTPPVLWSALGSNTPTRILISFSESISSSTVTVLSNYRVHPLPTGANLTISAAALANRTNIILTTSPRTAGVNYLLTVSNVRDLVNNLIAPGSQVTIATETVLLAGDNQMWRYYQSNTDPGFGWMAPGFDDSVSPWASGPALFDAKRPPRSTLSGSSVRTQLSLTNPPAATDQSLAYYFRAVFDLAGPLPGVHLRLRALADDGAVFYLNGREVHRLQMPEAPEQITYSVLATDQIGDGKYQGPFELPADALLPGENVFAAEVHQGGETSSDISFAAQLVAELPTIGFPPPDLVLHSSAAGAFLTWTRPDAVLQEAQFVTGPWNDVSPPAASPFALPLDGASRFYRLRAPR